MSLLPRPALGKLGKTPELPGPLSLGCSTSALLKQWTRLSAAWPRRDGLLLLLVLLGGLPMPLQPEKEDAWPYHTLKQAKLALKRLDLG